MHSLRLSSSIVDVSRLESFTLVHILLYKTANYKTMQLKYFEFVIKIDLSVYAVNT